MKVGGSYSSRYRGQSVLSMGTLYFIESPRVNSIPFRHYQMYRPREGERLDQIAYKFYKDSKLDWVLALANNIKDPLMFDREEIIIPDQNEVIMGITL